jgi:hypothetical protein
MFGYSAQPPFVDPKTVKPKDAVQSYMDYLSAKRGILGKISPTKTGVATDIGMSLTGVAPGPVIGVAAAGVNVIGNYYSDKSAAIEKLKGAGYSAKDIDSSFQDYEAGLVAGLDGIGGSDGENERELSGGMRQLAEALKAEQEGTEVSKTSTSQESNVEEMRVARKKKTQRVFGGQLGSTDSGNQVKKAKLLGQ